LEVFTVAKIEINVDDATLCEAENVLNSLGMNTEIAVNIFLRRVVLEKGLPISMAASVTKQTGHGFSKDSVEAFDYDSIHATRSNNKITPEMVEEVWQSFLRYLDGASDIKLLSTELSKRTGINRGSAFIYLNILVNLVKGEPNTRTMKMIDLEYYMRKIRNELGESRYQAALKSLMSSVPYWREKLPGSFADKVEAYCR
jgi:addiction module RelB/DinJ family antitoxin